MGRSTVCMIVKETCEVIWKVLQPQYVRAPLNAEEWKGVSKQFEQIWNFPNCTGSTCNTGHQAHCLVICLVYNIIGSIDGKHIVIQAPINAGSYFYNYKGSHSVVLLAVCVQIHTGRCR